MKIIVFKGGLGNQLYQYMYYKRFQSHCKDQMFYGYYPNKELSAHNGLEIEKWFDVVLPKSSFITNVIGLFAYYVSKILRKIRCNSRIINLNGNNSKALYHEGYWLKYEDYDKMPLFKKDLELDPININMLNRIKETNSVAIHIRRGDYMNPKVQNIYGGICTLEYYKKAIEKIEGNINNPHYFFFSDEPSFVEENFKLDNMIIVNNNKGEKSFFDMYLMSHCKYMVIANSTFSCWAAYLNKNVIDVICPKKWFAHGGLPDLYKEKWIRI